jgi:nucleotide-binding universal stress UspA family protein
MLSAVAGSRVDSKGHVMKKILIASHGSDVGNAAVDVGLDLAADEGAEVVFAHVGPEACEAPLGLVLAQPALAIAGQLPHDVVALSRVRDGHGSHRWEALHMSADLALAGEVAVPTPGP